jgi:hypothetical protein
MSTSLNARHRRRVQRARSQGKADGPTTLAAMAQVYTTARVQRLEDAAAQLARENCTHRAQQFTQANGYQCLRCGVTL